MQYFTNYPFFKMLTLMKIIVIILLGASLQISARGYAQRISLQEENAPLGKIFQEIRMQTGYQFLYNDQVLQKAENITIRLTDASLEETLRSCFRDQPLSYRIVDKTIIVQPLEEKKQPRAFRLNTTTRADTIISGNVTDTTGAPLPGVSVMIAGTNTGTSTNLDGAYSLQVEDPEAVLIFSFLGYKTLEIQTEGKPVISVVLEEDIADLDQVVIIGYGTAKKRDLTGSVTRIDAQVFRNQPMVQLTEMLTGTVAGFSANQGTSAAGGSSMELRGQNSLTAGTQPLIVLDGVIYNGNIRNINPSDVETIDILKDASAAAVYGARAASGVVIITTKKGTTDKPTIEFSVQVGMAQAANDFEPYNAEEYLNFRRDVLRSYTSDNPDFYYYNPNALPEGITLQQWRDASNNPQDDNTREWLSRLRFFPIEVENYIAGNTVNWYDKVIKSGMRQNYDLSIGGRSDRFQYYWSLGYDDNEGIVTGDKYSVFRTRLNADFKVTDWLNVGLNSQVSSRDESAVPADMGGMNNTSPYGSEYDEEGNLKWFPHDYELARHPLINYYGQDRLTKIYTLFASVYASIKLPLGVDYKLSFQPRYDFIKNYNFWSSQTITGGRSYSQGRGTREESSQYEWILDNLLNWNKQTGVHRFNLTLLYSAEQNRYWSSNLANQTFLPNQNLGFNGLQFGSDPFLSNRDTELTGDAAMARLNYTLLDKYLFTASVRRDGFSAFGQKNPRAWFPAGAFAWKISDEGFYDSDFINRLKLRVSWGVNGNRDIGEYAALAQLSPNFYYDGTRTQVGVFSSSLANPDLVWERTESVNIGLDFGLLNDRVDVSADYYNATTTNLLMNRLLPRITGFSEVTSNLGELENRGFELTVNTVNMDKPGFGWRSNVVFSFNRNKIKRLFGDYEEVEVNGERVQREVPDYSNEWFPGEAIDRVWNYDITGVWQLDEAEEAAVYRMVPGDFKARDVNEDGVYDELDDKVFTGYGEPRYRMGLRNDFAFLKNFTASFFIRAELGHIGSFSYALHRGSETYHQRNAKAIPYWTPENPINDYARLNVNENGFGGDIMIYKPRSFVRIQDISLSYNFPAAVAQRLRMNSMRVFASARNFHSFDRWPGWDPESGDSPMPRIYTLGLSLSL